MSAVLTVEVDAHPIERVPADVAVVTVFRDERPLRGAAGRADWRLCGQLSELLATGRLGGEPGEAALLPAFGGLRAPLLVILGLGARSEHDARGLEAVAEQAAERGVALRAHAVALELEEGASAVRDARAVLAGAARAVGRTGTALRIRLAVAPGRAAAVGQALRDAARGSIAADVAIRFAGQEGPEGRPRSRAPAGTSPLVK